MERKYLGIDLGTSAVKLLLVTPQGDRKRAKCPYSQANASGWREALKLAVDMLKQQDSLESLCGIALSSQVGTYLTDTGELINWESAAGKDELRQIKASVPDAQWIEQIGMTHPDLVSYPLPRLLYIKRHYPQCRAVRMPKELLLQELTGNTVTDPFSWRGLCDPDKNAYSSQLLKQFEIPLCLPPIGQPTDCAGQVSSAASKKYGLPVGTPVYIGCNDFYAGLLGMGVLEKNTLFELSGTSEHVGVITAQRSDGAFVSGRYFHDFATYGGTKSSGTACAFAIRHFGIDGLDADGSFLDAPIFLPYLNGERAPIYDENAKGVFFGIDGQTASDDMAYAVLEGVVFSLYHIYESLPHCTAKRFITGGGSAGNMLMARLKAALFDCSVLRVTENDASALGAAILAMVGSGEFLSLSDAVSATVSYEPIAEPDRKLRAQLLKRYAVFKDIYKNLKDTFQIYSIVRREK